MNKPSLKMSFRRKAVIYLLIITLSFVLIWFLIEAKKYINTSESNSIDLIKVQNTTTLNNNVDEVYSSALITRSMIEEHEWETVKNQIDSFYSIALGDLELLKNKMSIDEIRSHVLASYKDVGKNIEGIYFFSMNSRGDILYTELDEKMIGQNYWNAADSTGKFYVREMIEKAEIDGYAIVEYRFLIEKDGTTEIKRSYVKYIEELDMFIAAGIYQVAIEEQLYSFLENKLKTLNANGSNYIIINDPDRILKLNFLDSNIQFATDFKGLTDQIVSHVNNEMAFTVEHSYFNEMNDEFYYIGSFKYIDNWNIFLGEIVHFNMTELSQNNLLNSVESFSRLTLIILTVLVTLVILVAIIVYDFISKQHEQNLKISLKLIESLYDLSIESVVVTNKQKQILYGNNQANTMFNRVFSSGNYELIDSLIKKLGNENLTVVDRNDVEIIVDIHTEQINLHNEEFYIYFFRDVSDEFKYNKKLEIVAHTDHLTFLPNRRQFDYDFNHIVKSISRTNQSFILVYLDLDHFKNVNDKFGHDIGDKVLVSFASLFHNNSRDTDQLYRFGGEEFFMILQETELEVAKEVVKRFNRRLENYEWVQEDLKITFSAGLIVVNGNDLNKEFSYYFKKVDKLLYEAKERGRNLILTEFDL